VEKVENWHIFIFDIFLSTLLTMASAVTIVSSNNKIEGHVKIIKIQGSTAYFEGYRAFVISDVM
jgi:hypothetical protein